MHVCRRAVSLFGRLVVRWGTVSVRVLRVGTWERRVLLDLLALFSVAVPVLAAVLLSLTSMREVIPYGLSLRTMWRLLPFALPDALRYAIPAGLLFAISRVYSEKSADNEILAIKSSGVSPLRVIWPGIGMGLLLSPPVVWLTDHAVSWGHDGIQRVVMESVTEMAFTSLGAQRSYATPHFCLTVRRLEGEKLISPILQIRSLNSTSGSEAATTIWASTAVLEADSRSGTFRIVFEEGSVRLPQGGMFYFPDRHEASFTLSQASLRGSDEHFSLRTIYTEIHRSQQRVAELNARLKAISSRDHVEPKGLALRTVFASELAHEQVRLNELRSKPHRRWAHGFSCLAFAMFGIPWAVRSRDGDTVRTFFVSFVPVLLFYYPIEMSLASNASLPPYSIWVADGLLFVAGALLLRSFWKH